MVGGKKQYIFLHITESSQEVLLYHDVWPEAVSFFPDSKVGTFLGFVGLCWLFSKVFDFMRGRIIFLMGLSVSLKSFETNFLGALGHLHQLQICMKLPSNNRESLHLLCRNGKFCQLFCNWLQNLMIYECNFSAILLHCSGINISFSCVNGSYEWETFLYFGSPKFVWGLRKWITKVEKGDKSKRHEKEKKQDFFEKGLVKMRTHLNKPIHPKKKRRGYRNI